MKTNKIYYAIPALALFGDLLKCFMRADWALACLYTMAVLILVWMMAIKTDKQFLRPTELERHISYAVYYLVAVYCFQLTLSIDVPFLYALTHVVYICIPLLYIPILLKYCPEFDLKKLSAIFLLMMIPVNVVGLIQYAINPGFLISTVYSEAGGVIFRNSYQGVFLRFPSIFASADRYSAVGLMQFYFTIILLLLSKNKTKKTSLWIYFNLISSFAAMFIAGARSRILIFLLLVILMTSSSFITSLFVSRKGVSKLAVTTLIILALGILAFAFNPGYVKAITEAPFVEFLITSARQGDVQNRVGNYVGRTLLSDDISLFGKGLGSLGENGKPAEVGVESIWIECGLIGGSLVLVGFCGIMFILASLSFRAFIRGRPLEVCVFGLPALALMSGLLAGLTSVFELSSGILLMTGIGGTIRYFSPVAYCKRT